MWGLVVIVQFVWAFAGPFDRAPEPPELPDEVPEEAREVLTPDRGKKKDPEDTAARRRQDDLAKYAARVVVIQWPGTPADHRSLDLQRNVRNRIARPSAKFYPEIDLFQDGRTKPDPALAPIEQPGAVPDAGMAAIERVVRDVAGTPFDALSETAWALKASQMVRFATEEVWFVDRPELLEAVFRLYAFTGYAGENTNTNAPPYYQLVGGQTVNYYYYLAATLLYREASLSSALPEDPDVARAVASYRDLIEVGRFEPLKLSFEGADGAYDPQFAQDYRVVLNGIEVPLPDSGVVEVPLGVVDIDLVRQDDGHGLSQRFADPQFDEDYFFVQANARKRMGIDLKNQLMRHPSECIPQLQGDILDYLAVYGKLHRGQELYIVIPENGSTAPSRLFIWRWDPDQGVLRLVQDNTGGFPIVFAALTTFGAAFASVDFPMVTEDDVGSAVESQRLPQLAPQLDPEGLPFDFQLRGHYNRFLFGIGAQAKIGLSGGFSDKFRSRGGLTFDAECPGGVEATIGEDGAAGCPGGADFELVPKVNQRSVQRTLYAIAGVVLGRDAALGVGPRGYLRVGTINVPHALDTTLHLGLTTRIVKPPEPGTRARRLQPIADVDGFLGVWTPIFDSVFVRQGRAFGSPVFTFGLSAGAGLTF